MSRWQSSVKLRRDTGCLALHRRGELRLIGQRRIAAHPVMALHPAFGGQPVVVPSHRIEHRHAPHALETRDHIGLHVAEDASHVQLAACRGRGSVDRVHPVGGRVAIKAVGLLLLPVGCPLAGEAVEIGFHVMSLGKGARITRRKWSSRASGARRTGNRLRAARVGYTYYYGLKACHDGNASSCGTTAPKYRAEPVLR